MANKQELYRRAQSGLTVTCAASDFRWMQLQYDDFFFYQGVPWKLVGTSKGAGVYTVRRVPVAGVENGK